MMHRYNPDRPPPASGRPLDALPSGPQPSEAGGRIAGALERIAATLEAGRTPPQVAHDDDGIWIQTVPARGSTPAQPPDVRLAELTRHMNGLVIHWQGQAAAGRQAGFVASAETYERCAETLRRALAQRNG